MPTNLERVESDKQGLRAYFSDGSVLTYVNCRLTIADDHSFALDYFGHRATFEQMPTPFEVINVAEIILQRHSIGDLRGIPVA